MKNLKQFCEAIAPICEKCDDLFYSYEISRSLDCLDAPDDLRLRVFSGDNIIGSAILSIVPSFLDYSVSYNTEKGVYLMVW